MRIRAEADDYAWRQSDRFPSIGSDGELGEPNELFTGGRLTFTLSIGASLSRGTSGTLPGGDPRRMRGPSEKRAGVLCATEERLPSGDLRIVFRLRRERDIDDKKVRFWVGFFLAGG